MAPVSVFSAGRVLRSYRPHPGLTAAAVLKNLRDLGYQGHLEDEHGCFLTDDFVLVGGESYTLVAREGLSWFQYKLPSASSLAVNPGEMKRFMGGDEPIYDLGRTSTAIPLQLTVDAFGAYATASKSRELNSTDWDFVCNVMEMSGFFNDEKEREGAFARHLESYLVAACSGVRFRFTRSIRGNSMPGIRVEVWISGEWITIVMVEVKVELGGGETSIQAMKYYGDHTKLLWEQGHWSYQSSCCPVLMIELAGPHIRVGGAASYVEKPAYQPFTPLLHIYKFLQDADHLSVLSRALGSIGDAINALVVFYDNLSSSTAQLTRGPQVEWPCLIRGLQEQGATVIQSKRPEAAGSLRVMNVGRSKQLLFGVQLPGGSRRIIKFCQRYGTRIHQDWAAEGYAPQFTPSTLPGGWLVIDMEFYSEDDGWLPLVALDPRMVVRGDAAANRHRLQPQAWEVCKSKVVEAYKTLRYKFPLVVHGDLRKANILYNLASSRVAFIDFDWAGVEGQAVYPLLINMLVKWPAGVGPCKPMTVDNDWEVLASELGVPLN